MINQSIRCATVDNLPTMSAHDLHNKCSLMRIRRTDDCIDGFDDTVQRRVGTDCHVRAAEIIIDRTNHPGDVQTLELESLLLGDLTILQQLIQ